MKSNLIQIYDTLGKQDEQPESYSDRFKVENIPGGLIVRGKIITFNSILGEPVSIPAGNSGDFVGFLLNVEKFSRIGGYSAVYKNGGASPLYLDAYSINRNKYDDAQAVYPALNDFYSINGDTGTDKLYNFVGRAGNLKLNNMSRLAFFAYYTTTPPSNPGTDLLQWVEFMIKLLI